MTANGFELKGSSFTLSVLRLTDTDLSVVRQGLEQKIAQAPRFFVHAPIVIDLSQVSEATIDFVGLSTLINELGVLPVGVVGASEPQQQLAWDAGLAILHPAKQPAPAQAPQKPAQPPQPAPLKVIERPVRSGQQIYAKDSSLIIYGAVSAGAEVIADGSIHVHGALRGRAIAGASGDRSAKIYCQTLQPELVSIDGNYWLSENVPPQCWGESAAVFLQDERLSIKSLG